MKLVSAFVAVIALLTWLSLRSSDTGSERFDQALTVLNQIGAVEATLRSSVLSARAGLLRNYDPIVRETDELDSSLDRLRTIMSGDVTASIAIDRLTGLTERQESLLELFKTNNALLQNSLAYFALFSSNMDKSGQIEAVTPATSALLTAMLRLTLDTSAVSANEVQVRLDDLAQEILASDVQSPTGVLLAHGRLLHDLLPATDKILKQVSGIGYKQEMEAVRSVLVSQKIASSDVAGRFRLSLYSASLLLLGLLAYVGLMLRARARALRSRAAFEHVLASISMRFLTTQAENLDSVIRQALAEMAACLCADRAYLLVSGSPSQTYAWCRQGLSFPIGWPERAALLPSGDYPQLGGVTHVSRIERLPPGEAKDALASADLQGWACVTSKDSDGASVLLGFDAVSHPSRIMPGGELGLLRMALDTLANALRRRSLQQEHARLSGRLEQARRLETVGALASGIAHNFNNIIGAILGYVEFAGEREGPSRVLDDIRRAAGRARELVDQILSFARRGDAHREAVSIRKLISEASSLLQASLSTEIEIVTSEVPEALEVFGVPAQLQQVILNLCNNAAQAMRHTGRVEMDIAAIDLDAPRPLSHGMLGPGHYVRVAVSDSGSGIDSSALSRIFEPFFTTRLVGSGLGLATTRDIVREHGGAMHVLSVIGIGTRFEVWLPSTDAAQSWRNTALPFGSGEVVLLLECDPDRLLRDEDVLAALGYEPVGFNRCDEAVAACKRSPERFDMILLAHYVPSDAMLEAANRLHNLAPHLPILLATSSAEAFGADELVRAGVSDIVPWPISGGEIAVTLRECLRRCHSFTNTGVVQTIGL